MRGPCLVALVTVTAAACAPEFDPVRTGVDPGTFGHRVVTLMCKRLAYQADPTDVRGDTYREACRGEVPMPDTASPAMIALAANRARVVKAIDAVVPEDVYDPLQAYLTSEAILGLYDDDTMSTTIASLGSMLQDMGADEAAMAAFERQGPRNGYRPVLQAVGPSGPLTSSPYIRDVLTHVLPTIVEGGSANAEWTALVAAISMTLADAAEPADAATPERTAAIATKFLLTEQADLGETTPLTMVRRDRRGVAQVALVGNAIPAPFADADGDKLADVDASGRFVDATGAPIAAPSPFRTSGDTATRDDRGRAVDAAGTPIYTYFDLDKTLAGAMAYDQPALLDPDLGTAMDLLRGTSVLLGERTTQTRTFDNGTTLSYRGYDTTGESPLLDLAHAFTQLLRDPNIRDTLALGDVLFNQHEGATARLLEAAIASARMGDAYPEAEILHDAPLWDDLLPLVRQITANPTLMRDIMRALEDPKTKLLITRFRDFTKFKNRFDIASNQTVTGSFSTVVDRNQPDSAFNRSIFARILHVISDSNGAVECSKAGAIIKHPLTGLVLHTFANECEFFRIDNMAVFFLQSIVYAKNGAGQVICEGTAGAFGATQTAATGEGCVALGLRPRRKANFNYQWPLLPIPVAPLVLAQGGDAYLEERSTIQGQRTYPTAEGLIRVLFLLPRPDALNDTTEPAKDKFGDLMTVKHVGTLPAWEKNGFLDQIRPTLQAFADNNAEQIFVDIMSVLHKHWSSKASTSTQHTSPNGPNFTYGSNLTSYEPLLIDVFEGDLWPALTDSSAELNLITVNGKPFSTLVANAGRFLVTPLAGLADRSGITTTLTSDGRPVNTLAPFHLLADAEVRKRARLAANPALAETWTKSAPELVDLWFRGEQVAGSWRFKNRHQIAVTRAATQMLRDRIVAHDAAGDRVVWLGVDLPKKLHDFFTHPIVAAAADFIEAQSAGPGKRALEMLLRDVFTPGTPGFDTMRIGGADLMQLSHDDAELVPLAQLAGRLIAADKTYLATQLAFLSKLHAADTESTLTNLVARLFRPFDDAADPGIPAISAIIDGVGEVDRTMPSALTPPWMKADYQSIFLGIGAFMHEEQRGLPRFITIVKGREP